MRTHVAVAVAGFGVLLLAAATVRAHHSFAAEFDAKKPVNLRGAVVKVEWINPHTWIHVGVKNPDGSVTTWMVEGGSPNMLFRRGINRNSLPVGTEILVDGYQARSGTNRANGRDLTFPDGRKLFLGSSGTDAPSDGRDPTER